MKNSFIKLALVSAVALASIGTQAAVTLKLSHNQGTNVPVHQAMQFFADKVKEYTHGEVKVRIYPNAQLGTQRESVELVQSGGIALAKTNAAELEAFVPEYGVFNLPYLFKDQDHFYRVLMGKVGDKVLSQGVDKGLIGITYYDAGSRSFYSKKPFKTPDDLKGLKVRVQPSPTAVKLVELLGAHPTPIAFGELYTALQQGVVDAAENNESALVDARHGEVAKFYSYDQHTMIPDVLVMSKAIWDKLTPEQQVAIKKAGRESMLKQRDLWNENTKRVIAAAQKDMGVTFVHDVDIAAFKAKVSPMVSEAEKSSPEMAELIKNIQAEENP